MTRTLARWSAPALLLAAALLGAACGGGTEPRPLPEGTPRMRKIAGDSQRTPVTDNSGMMVAQVYRDTSHGGARVVARLVGVGAGPLATGDTQLVSGVPMPNTLVNFVPDDPDKGRPWAGSTMTDSNGLARDYIEAGTKAGGLHVYVRAVDQATGARIVYDSFFVQVKPGAPADLRVTTGGVQAQAGDSIDIHGLLSLVLDAYGNYIWNTTHPELTQDSSYVPKWTWRAYADSTWPTTPTDSGWTAIAPPAPGAFLVLTAGTNIQAVNVQVP